MKKLIREALEDKRFEHMIKTFREHFLNKEIEVSEDDRDIRFKIIGLDPVPEQAHKECILVTALVDPTSPINLADEFDANDDDLNLDDDDDDDGDEYGGDEYGDQLWNWMSVGDYIDSNAEKPSADGFFHVGSDRYIFCTAISMVCDDIEYELGSVARRFYNINLFKLHFKIKLQDF